jgi:hypothetical protein
MSDQLKQMLKEVGLQIGLILLQKYQRYIEKDDVTVRPRRRSSDVKLTSASVSSNGEPD